MAGHGGVDARLFSSSRGCGREERSRLDAKREQPSDAAVPLLSRETDLYPADLLDREETGPDSGFRWWAVYTRSRREKDLMRRLKQIDLAFYCPLVEKRYRSPAGRARCSFLPLFPNYVFVWGGDDAGYLTKTTGCTSGVLEVRDGEQLTDDLRRVRHLITSGAPLTLEERLQAGRAVRVRSGPFKGHEGTVIERRGERRLFVAVNFLKQGVSVEIDDYLVEPVY